MEMKRHMKLERFWGEDCGEKKSSEKKYNSTFHSFVKSSASDNLISPLPSYSEPPAKIYITPPPLPHLFQNTKSQPTSVMHSPTLAQNTTRATLPRSAARFSSRLPPPTLSAALSESATSCCTCAD